MSTITIPNELKITINTSVPGYQKLNYDPHMTIPDLSKDEKNIRFDPLIKLNKSIINKVSESVRIKEFFNKGLFQSLLNYHGVQPLKTLKQAALKDYINDNIKTTLDTIFPINSVLYINKQPYVISDVQWTRGDWKVDIKQKKPEYDSSKIRDPYLYASVVKEEIISGEKQLQEIPPDLLYGNNYVGVKSNVASGVNTNVSPTHSPTTPTPTPVSAPTTNVPINAPSTTTTPTTTTNAPTYTISKPQLLPPPPRVNILPLPPPAPAPLGPTPIKVLTNTPESSRVEELSNQEPTPEPVLKVSKSTLFLKQFFENKDYYFMINSIYKNMQPEFQKKITKMFATTTTIAVKENTDNISVKAYNETVKDLKVKENHGNGDCFFIAVADAINYNNHKNPHHKITSGIYGIGNKIFTQSYLRSLVANYIINFPDLDIYLQHARINAEHLNTDFENQIKFLENNGTEISEEVYIENANNIYMNGDNFLVEKPKSIPIDIDNYYKPFTVIQKSQIKKYIESNDYWANIVAIDALCETLQLNIIPIERTTDQSFNRLRIPYANLLSTGNDKWTKYLFLYYYGSHYELITFNFTHQQLVTTMKKHVVNITHKVAIFDRNDYKVMPPLYILFLIYGSFYNVLNNESKHDFSFYPGMFNVIDSCLKNIEQSSTDMKNKFMQLSNKYFPKNQTGGQRYNYRYNNPYPYNPYPYNNPYNSYYNPVINKMLKKEDEKEKSNLAYDITIDMELHPGTKLTPAELRSGKCNNKWNAVRKSYATLTGQQYIIPPVYDKLPKNKSQKENKDQKDNKDRKYIGGRTRKNREK